MRTDKQLYKLLGASPEIFRLLTGVKLKGEYHLQSVAFKELSLTCDGLNVPVDATLPIYVVETQAQKDDYFLDRLLMEIILAHKKYPGRVVLGMAVFLDHDADAPDSPWRKWLGHKPLLPPIYLIDVLASLRGQSPDHPLLAACLPLTLKDDELIRQAPGAWARLASSKSPWREELENVFLSWMSECFKNKSQKKIKSMLNMMTPLEETRLYKEIIAIGWRKGQMEGELKGQLKSLMNTLSRQLARKFGPVPEWAANRLAKADATQLEKWTDDILDAQTLEDLLGRPPRQRVRKAVK